MAENYKQMCETMSNNASRMLAHGVKPISKTSSKSKQTKNKRRY
jgi:hypothetical protein